MPIVLKLRSHTLNQLVKKRKIPKNTSFRVKTFQKLLFRQLCQHSVNPSRPSNRHERQRRTNFVLKCVRRYSIVATCIFRHNEGFDTKKFIRHIQSDMKTECMTFPLRLKWKNTWSSFFIIFQHKSHQGHQEKRTAISRN